MNRRIGMRRRERRRKHILFAALGVVMVAAIATATVLLVKSAKKVPEGEGDAKPVSSVLLSADELIQNGDYDGALALLASTPEEDENHAAALE